MIRVTCAIIRNEDNEILVVQRGENTDHPFKWEFPGGKLRDGETDEECIIREIGEELSMDVIICSRLEPFVHDYGQKKITLIPFICDTLDELPELTEHEDFKWIPAEDLASVDFCEADLPVALRYMEVASINAVVVDQASETGQSAEIDEALQKMINSMMSMQEAEWVAASAGENPVLFKKLLDYSYSPDKKLAFRASWTLSKVCDRYPELIHPHLPKIVEEIGRVDNEGTQRSFLRILSMTDRKSVV